MEKEVRQTVALRLTASEKALLTAAAKEVGLTLSSWIRTVTLASARKVIGTKDGTGA
jgi:uncharacterized protein (DUF1778 family)